MIHYQYLCIFFLFIAYPAPISSRSIHHSSTRNMPCIITQWADHMASSNQAPKQFRLYHNNLEVGPIFHQYDRAYFEHYLLPAGDIIPRAPQNNQHNTPAQHNGAELGKLLQELVQEIQSLNYRRSEYKNFIVIKQRDFNPKTHAGLIILKFKNHPFIVKLFMETPATFVAPFSKGFEPMVFFIMGSGINRYLSGFSRIRNAEAIRKAIAASPFWRDQVDLPRKWFWEPVDQKWFTVTSEHLGTHQHTVRLPSVYAIVCDAINIETPLQMLNPDHRRLGMELSRFLGSRVDPHIDNFVIEADTGLVVIVDSECFSIMVGLREQLICSNYTNWYYDLSIKCLCDGFGRSKEERLYLQQQDHTSIICC